VSLRWRRSSWRRGRSRPVRTRHSESGRAATRLHEHVLLSGRDGDGNIVAVVGDGVGVGVLGPGAEHCWEAGCGEAWLRGCARGRTCTGCCTPTFQKPWCLVFSIKARECYFASHHVLDCRLVLYSLRTTHGRTKVRTRRSASRVAALNKFEFKYANTLLVHLCYTCTYTYMCSRCTCVLFSNQKVVKHHTSYHGG
jgi:hypothetical protein